MVGDIFQPTHLLFVLVVALLVLGPKRLPEVGRTLGAGIRDFRQALSGESDHTQRTEPGQVSNTATDLHQQPDTAIQPDLHWPEPAVGPISFDEPVEAASPEPTPASATATEADIEWPEQASGPASFDEPAEAASPEPAAAAPAESADTPVGTHGAADAGHEASVQPTPAEPTPAEQPVEQAPAEHSGPAAAQTDSHD